MGNNDLPDDYFDPTISERLPNSPHGLNSFQHYHHAVIISALNPPPAHFKFMDTMGIDEDELRTHHYRNAVYQAAMRISIRNPLDANPKTITVMDADTAYWLQSKFIGAAVQQLTGFNLPITSKPIGRPRKFPDAAKKQKAYRLERKMRRQKLSTELRAVNGLDLPDDVKPEFSFGTAYGSIFEKDILTHLELQNDEEFIQLLREIYERKISSKHENYLFSPAHFDANIEGVETKRGKENIKYIRGIWLDNDGGDLTHQKFSTIFSDLRMVVWNTYSSTNHNPRWRCFIPTTEVMGVETYACVLQQMVQRLSDYGYLGIKAYEKRKTGKRHGFDESKFVPNSLFYAPCQAADEGASFFEDYNGERRKPLNPFVWVEYDTRRVNLPKQVAVLTNSIAANVAANTSQVVNINQPKIDAAITNWRNSSKGEGHRAFFTLGARLKAARMNMLDIEQTLRAEAMNAHNPKERIGEIKEVMKSLRKSNPPLKKKLAA